MTPRENAVSLLRKITEVQHRSVEQTRAELDLNQLIRVYQRLLDAQHLDFYAYDRSACIAEYRLQSVLLRRQAGHRSTGTPICRA